MRAGRPVMEHRRLRSGVAIVAVFVLLAAVPLTVDGQGGAAYEVTDPAGDVALDAVVGTAPVPGAAGPAATDAADLRALRIVEDTAHRLVFEVEVADIAAPHTNWGNGFYDYVAVRFMLDGHPVHYVLFVSFYTPYSTASTSQPAGQWAAGRLCLSDTGEVTNDPFFTPDCYLQEALAYSYFEEDIVRVAVPKLSLLGLNPREDGRPGGLPKTLPAGVRIVGLQAESVQEATPFICCPGVVYRDALPDEGEAPAYALKTAAANTAVRIGAPTSQWSMPRQEPADPLDETGMLGVGVAPGIEAAVPLTVSNEGEGKKLVNLTHEFLRGGELFEARLAGSLEVPSGDERTATLLIKPRGALSHGQDAVLRVYGRSIGHEDEFAEMDLRVIGTLPPGPDRQTLHFHADEEYEGTLPRVGGVALVCVNGCTFRYASWMNTVDDDPAGQDDETGSEGGFTYFNFLLGAGPNTVYANSFPLDAPLPADLAFGAAPATAALTFRSDVVFDAEATLRFWAIVPSEECDDGSGGCFTEVQLGEGTGPVSVDSEGGTATVSLAVSPEANGLDLTGGRLGATVLLDSLGPDGSVADHAGVWFIPASSSLTLPLVEAPVAPSGAGLLGVYAAGESEEFLNPGKARAFHVIVVNEGVEAMTARVTTEISEGWSVVSKPASRYALKPGESVNMTLLVTAPQNATEGERGLVRVAAAAESADAVSKPLALSAIVTTGIQIEDEGGIDSTDPDAAARAVVDEGGRSPGVGMLAALLVLGGVGILVRERAEARRRG